MKNFKEINRTFTVKKTKFLQRVLWLMIPLLTIFTTNVWGADYQLITSTSDLESGAHYILGATYNSTFYCVATTSNTNNRKIVSQTVSAGKVTPGNTVMTFTLGGSSSDGWTFKTDNYGGTAGYLNATSTTSSNYLKVVSTLDNYAKFSISITAAGVATITCNGKSSRHIMYLNGTTCVACYDNQTGAQYVKLGLYKEVSSCSVAPTVGSTLSSVSSTVNSITATVPISAIGGCNITENGLVYSTFVATPTVGAANCYTATTTACGGTAANKTVTISDLTCGTSYYVRGYATNGAGTSYTNVTTQSTSACTLYTVSFETGTGNPPQADITETVAGAGITLPAGPTPACSGDGWSFAGWGYERCDETSDEPYLYFPGNTYYPADDETLYAVYVQGETSTTTYKLLSEGAQVAPDANYIITATAVDKAIKSEVYSSYYIEATDVTVTEDENGYYIANPNSELIWNMGKTGSTISLYNASDNKYLKIYETSGHHNLALDASKHTFTLSEVRNPGYASTFKMESTNDPGYYVLYSTSNTDFTATNNDDLEDTELYLYKQMHSGTYNSNPICCDNEVTLAHNSPTNGTVSFAPAGPIETCDGTVNTTMTITPAAGYTLTAFNYSTGAGTVSPTNQSPGAPNVTANSATPQAITLTFAQDANGTCTANATFSAIVPTAWSWTYNSAAIPNPINLYIGQTAALVATYTPAGNLLVSAEKNYDVVKPDGLTQVSKTYAVTNPTYTFRADAVMDDGTIILTNHNHTSLTTTVHVHVAPLPLVHFVDIVHGYAFDDVVGTIEDNDLVSNKTTPTHAEYSGTGANDCETDHTRLVGWIEKTWADAHPDASHSDIIGAGTGVFIEANAAINVLTYNGNTYYAVWASLQ